MKTVAVINIKGGVGKTISAVNIGVVLGELGSRVLIVDLDPQANATQLLRSYSMERASVCNVFLEKDFPTVSAIFSTQHTNVDILPSHIGFAYAEGKIITDTTRQQQTRLRKALKQVSDKYDYCILDCPPNIGVITINALAAADGAIVPIKIDQFALDGLDYLISTIYDIKSEFNESLSFLGSFVTMDNATSVNKQIKKQLEQTPILKMYNTAIKTNVKVPESTFSQLPVVVYDKKSPASIAYRELTNEILARGI